jgi:hypothetical protein
MVPMEQRRRIYQRGRFRIPLAFARFSTSFKTLLRSRRLSFNRFMVVYVQVRILGIKIWGRLLVARRTAFLNGRQPIAGFDLLLH